MLKVITKIELVSQYANAANKFCIYISTTEKDSVDEIQMAVPFLSAGNCFLLLNDFLVLTFDTEKEMEEHFDKIICDIPSPLEMEFGGKALVYALTISNKGEFLDENT